MKNIVEVDDIRFEVIFHVNGYDELIMDEIRLENSEINLYPILHKTMIDAIFENLYIY